MAIRLLDRDTIEKITAGEVIERPVSAVKELVENAIDAGSCGISVEIRGGGAEYIRVSDNGCGIPAEEVKLAFTSHATSKLKNADELSSVLTMGFRGEALPSISAVAKVTLTTRTAGAEAGVKICVEAGQITSISEAGCPEGTTVEVRDMFFNVPVRRSFMKKPAYEQSLISELIERIALGNPLIAFRLTSQGKALIKTYGSGDVVQTAAEIYGKAWADSLRRVNETEGAITLKGYIGIGDQAQPTRARQCYFINGRLVSCRVLSQALEEACRGRVTIGRYPSCALNVTLPTALVDVNAHPGKLEVRFRDEASFRLTAQTLLARAFAGERMMDALLPKIELPPLKAQVELSQSVPAKEEPCPEKPKPAALDEVSAPKAQSAFDYLRTLDIDAAPKAMVSEVREAPIGVLQQKASQPEKPVEATTASPVPQQTTIAEAELNVPAYRLIGVYLNTYILLEYRQSLIMIDQHAAHERLNYEKYTKALDEGVASQPLLLPVVLELGPRDRAILQDSMDVLKDAGYEIELFGDGALRVTAVPFIYGQGDMRLLFTEMLDELKLLKNAEKERRLASVIQASCKHAVKGGDRLSEAEIQSLLEMMNASGAPPTCPHGRPIIKVFTKRSVEQMFKRLQ